MTNKIRVLLLTSIALAALSIPAIREALAAPSVGPYVVDSNLDQIDDNLGNSSCHTAANTCTLRAAIMQANRIPAPGVTIIVPAGAYTLTLLPASPYGDDNGDLNLSTPTSGNPLISIVGAGADKTFIDGDQIDRVFRIESGRSASISGLTIRNGNSHSSDGGGIWNYGMLTLSNVIASGNHATQGGGIFNYGSVSVLNSTVNQNTSQSAGGGIANYGDLQVRNSTIGLNTTGVYGGGVYTGLTLTLASSTVYGNHSLVNGGGIFNDGYFTAVNSTFSQNSADNNGGGIHNRAFNSNGLAAVYNSTIADNDADDDHDENGGTGGGVYNEVAVYFKVVNTIIARNIQLTSFGADDCHGALDAYGLNLLGDPTGCTINSGNWSYIPLSTFGPLQANGGPTLTHALLQGSQAINSTFDFLGCIDEKGATLTVDQRGAPRPVGVRCDIGAFEYRPPLYLPLILR